MSRRARIAIVVAVATLAASYLIYRKLTSLPPETTPEGAYVRIAHAIAHDRPIDCFPYLEERAREQAATIREYAAKASARIQSAYPPEVQPAALAPYRELAQAADGPEAFALLAARRGFIGRLRRDLSGVAAVEIADDLATITTARGTRYAFRRRPDGIWGLTLFTAELDAEAERLARDWEVIDKAAADYDREKGKD